MQGWSFLPWAQGERNTQDWCQEAGRAVTGPFGLALCSVLQVPLCRPCLTFIPRLLMKQ